MRLLVSQVVCSVMSKMNRSTQCKRFCFFEMFRLTRPRCSTQQHDNDLPAKCAKCAHQGDSVCGETVVLNHLDVHFAPL